MLQAETEEIDDFIWVIDCDYEGPEHEYPADWRFGGAVGTDPRSDVRWMPTTYQYFDDRLNLLHTTQTPLCDDQAVDEFTRVAQWGPKFRPRYLTVKRPGEEEFKMLPWEYCVETDTATEVSRDSS